MSNGDSYNLSDFLNEDANIIHKQVKCFHELIEEQIILSDPKDRRPCHFLAAWKGNTSPVCEKDNSTISINKWLDMKKLTKTP